MTRLVFTDYDGFAEALRDVSVTMRLCAWEVSRWSVQHATIGALGVQRGFEGGGSIAQGATRPDGWTFYRQSHTGRANGQVMQGGEVFAAPPGTEFCLVCKPSHSWLSLFVPTALLFPSEPEAAFAFRAGAARLQAPPHVTQRFTSLVQRFLSATQSRPQLIDHPAALDACRDELVSAAQELFAGGRHPASRHIARWLRLTRSALEDAMSPSDRSPSIPELARRAGTPERTLRRAFHESYGVSPQEYLRIERLRQAWRLLRASEPDETTVTQVAFGLGFWDLGRFAAAYRTLFGELPSETLRKPAQRSIGARQH